MKYPERENLKFTIKSEKELRDMSLHQLDKYYHDEQKRCAREHCFFEWPDEDYKDKWKAWALYITFVRAIYTDRTAKEGDV